MIDKKRSTFARCVAVSAAALFFTVVPSAQTTATPAAQTPAKPAPQPPATPTRQWTTYTYPADGFSASYPIEPDVQKRDISTGTGSFELRSYVAQVLPVALLIGVCDYGAAGAGKNPDNVLEAAKDGALSNSNAHLLSEKKISHGIYYGVAFEAESDVAHFSYRIYMVGATLYQTMVVAPLGNPFADATRFLDSFHLIARVKN